jgi:hypothetical protein
MTCKYFDSGWCYAPEDVEHNSKNGSCIEPLSCPYRKSQMTNQQPPDIIEIGGVKYQRLTKPKPPTLYDTFIKEHGDLPMGRKDACDIVRGWLIDHTVIETEDAERVTFTILKEQLQTPK